MKQRSTQKLLETSSTTSVWNWKNSKNKRSKNQRKKNASKRISNKPLMPVADYSAEEVKFLYESKSGKTTRNSMNFDHQQIQLPAIAQWAILPLFTNFYFFKTKLIEAVNVLTKYLYCLLGWSAVWHFATPERLAQSLQSLKVGPLVIGWISY